MSALSLAEQHLSEALSRLEKVMARRLAAADPDQAAVIDRLSGERDKLVQDVEDLKTECTRLSDALQQTKREREEIKETTEQVASRLDGSIEELDRMIGD